MHLSERYKKLADKIVRLQYPYLEQAGSATRQRAEKDRDKVVEMIKEFILEEKPYL